MRTKAVSVVGVILAGGLLLAGCTARPYYRPFDGSVGYSDAAMQPDVVAITYNGESVHSTGQATWFATLRAAEIAFDRNKPFFELTTVDRAYNVKSETVPGRIQVDDYYKRNSDRSYTNTTYTPGHTFTSNLPVVTLEAKLLDAKTERAFSTDEVIRDGISKGITFGPRVSQAFGVPVENR
jgi:hypothetical protein